MGCSFSRLNALYDAVNGGGDEVVSDPSSASVTSLANKVNDPSHLSDDGTYAMKKVLIQNSEQLELVCEEIRVSSLFSHPNLLPLLDHAIISIKLSASSSIMLMSGLGFMCRNGHLSTVQHLFELLSYGTA
ncbi:hypothetical protein V6N11_058118 [Hibiscus sabdariffa]|uniref:Uncharacterized protein n=2 Tax=Hibiscus sabdariffa TaxID=183260 RepID=A0ABR2BRE1_9ROSI